jgi:hypothetical protein
MISRRIRSVDRLGDNAFKTELAGVPEDEFTVTCLMAIELKAGLVTRQDFLFRMPPFSPTGTAAEPPHATISNGLSKPPQTATRNRRKPEG